MLTRMTCVELTTAMDVHYYVLTTLVSYTFGYQLID